MLITIDDPSHQSNRSGSSCGNMSAQTFAEDICSDIGPPSAEMPENLRQTLDRLMPGWARHGSPFDWEQTPERRRSLPTRRQRISGRRSERTRASLLLWCAGGPGGS